MNQAEKRVFLIKRLLDEDRRYRGMEVPADSYEQKRKATYACINLGEAITMKGIEMQSILLDADIGAVLSDLR